MALRPLGLRGARALQRMFGRSTHRRAGSGGPAAYELADGPKALAELEARAMVGKLALLP